MSKRHKAKRRLRYFAQRGICQVCRAPDAVLCYLPDVPRVRRWRNGRVSVERAPDAVLCGKHASASGYCRCCGDFWGGIDSFEFLHPGVCDHCYDQVQEDWEEEEPWDEYPERDYDMHE